jgi:oligopeptide/dipeptide ABC transporter ATP-binding protein
LDVLEVRDLTTHFFMQQSVARAVENVSFTLKKGEKLGLAGESGCGKTTTALSIMKLLPPGGRILKGEILLDDEDLVKKTDREMNSIRWKKISIVFQGAMNALNPVIRVGDQVTEAIAEKENLTKAEALQRARSLFELVGLDSSRVTDYPHEFSGGMRQRVMIAMALACNPSIVIADEPVTALDVVVQARILELIKELQKQLSLSVIMITHDLSVIAETCDRVAIMYAGKIAELGKATDIYKDSWHPYTEALITAFPSIAGPKRRFNSVPGDPPDLTSPPSGCRFHPRCPWQDEMCRDRDPEYREVGPDHYVACHHSEEIREKLHGERV